MIASMLLRGGVLVKYIFIAPLSWNEKSPKSFAKLRAVGNKKRQTSFKWLVCRLCRYSVVREFKSIRKGKTAVLHLRICNLKSRLLGSKKARYIGLFAEHIFFMFLLWRKVRDSNPRDLPIYSISSQVSKTELSGIWRKITADVRTSKMPCFQSFLHLSHRKRSENPSPRVSTDFDGF